MGSKGLSRGEIREYNERFPWRSLASIACKMRRFYGVRFAFKSNKKKGIRTLERVF